MQKITVTNDDGSTQDFFPQSYTDAAVAAVTPANTVAPEVTEVDLPYGRFIEEVHRSSLVPVHSAARARFILGRAFCYPST
jgi:hypothetical protein